MMSDNLRREDRVATRIEVLLVQGRRTIPLETSDVSFKGLFLQTDQPPPIRSLLRLRVRLPLREIEAHAMAVHVIQRGDAKSGVGLQFWGLAGPDRIAWDDFVKGLLLEKKVALKLKLKQSHPPPLGESGEVALPPPESGQGARLSDKTPSGVRIAEAAPLSSTCAAPPTGRAAKA